MIYSAANTPTAASIPLPPLIALSGAETRRHILNVQHSKGFTLMPRLDIYLLGPPRVELDANELDIPRRKALALLAYLAVERHSSPPR